MTSRDFCYWLQGYFEVANDHKEGLTKKQAEQIRNHLALVFKHEIDGLYGDAAHQAQLQAIHDGKPPGVTGPAGSAGVVPATPVTGSTCHTHPESIIYRC